MCIISSFVESLRIEEKESSLQCARNPPSRYAYKDDHGTSTCRRGNGWTVPFVAIVIKLKLKLKLWTHLCDLATVRDLP